MSERNENHASDASIDDLNIFDEPSQLSKASHGAIEKRGDKPDLDTAYQPSKLSDSRDEENLQGTGSKGDNISKHGVFLVTPSF